MSCEKLYFEDIACSNTTIELAEVESSDDYSVKLTHTGTNKDFWFTVPTGTTIQIDISAFNIDIHVSYQFSVYEQGNQTNKIPFGETGATTWTYTEGLFRFSASQSAGETLPTTATLEAI